MTLYPYNVKVPQIFEVFLHACPPVPVAGMMPLPKWIIHCTRWKGSDGEDFKESTLEKHGTRSEFSTN